MKNPIDSLWTAYKYITTSHHYISHHHKLSHHHHNRASSYSLIIIITHHHHTLSHHHHQIITCTSSHEHHHMITAYEHDHISLWKSSHQTMNTSAYELFVLWTSAVWKFKPYENTSANENFPQWTNQPKNIQVSLWTHQPIKVAEYDLFSLIRTHQPMNIPAKEHSSYEIQLMNTAVMNIHPMNTSVYELFSLRKFQPKNVPVMNFSAYEPIILWMFSDYEHSESMNFSGPWTF